MVGFVGWLLFVDSIVGADPGKRHLVDVGLMGWLVGCCFEWRECTSFFTISGPLPVWLVDSIFGAYVTSLLLVTSVVLLVMVVVAVVLVLMVTMAKLTVYSSSGMP